MIEPIYWQPPRRAARSALLGAGAGAAVLVVAAIIDLRQTLFSYLAAYTYGFTLFIGALLWLGAFHATKARWIVALRRPLEAMAAGGMLFLLLFIPVFAGLRVLYPWVHPDPARGAAFLAHMRLKSAYLNVGFFTARLFAYFVLWIAIGETFFSWSKQQDRVGGLAFTLRLHRFGPVSLPLAGYALTFAAVDWIMALQPEWKSTLFGLYVTAGALVGSLAAFIIVVALADAARLLPGVRPSHYHSLGKLLLAFVCFWGYLAFSQLLLLWIANIPEEIPYYQLRWRSEGWRGLSVFLILGHFVAPFFVLLSARLKRNPVRLAAVAAWILFVHWVDVYWLVMPYVSPLSTPHIQDVAALLTVVGAMVAYTLWRLRGLPTQPVGDPYLPDSLRYDK